MLNWVHDNDFDNHPHRDGTNTEIPNCSQNLLDTNSTHWFNIKIHRIILHKPLSFIKQQECDGLPMPYLLEMSYLICGIDKMGRLAEEGMNPSGNNYCFNLSLFACRA